MKIKSEYPPPPLGTNVPFYLAVKIPSRLFYLMLKINNSCILKRKIEKLFAYATVLRRSFCVLTTYILQIFS